MDWYFAENNQRFGPVGAEQFQRLVQEGRIRANTMVWAEGMANWMPYQHVYAQQVAQQESALPTDPATGEALESAGGQVAQAVAPAWGFCCQCGRMYPTDDMLSYEGHWVCAECKPMFFQRIREGVPLEVAAAGVQQPLVHYGGFWIRFAAVLIDGILLAIVNVPLGLLAGGSFTFRPQVVSPFALLATQMLVTLIQLAVGITYETMMIGRYGATLGKMACGLRVVTADGGKVTYLRAFARYWAKLLSQLTIYIGFIIAAFDSEKRALHDHICGTRVVHK